MKKRLIIAFVILLASIVAALLLRKDGYDGGERERPSPAGAALQGYMNSTDSLKLFELAAERPGRKVILIGLDAASWNIIRPMVEEGLLPTFAKLMREGAYGDLNSSIFAFTPPGWTAMFSGCDAWKTGIYGFGKLDTTTGTIVPVHSTDVGVPRIWNMTSMAGLRTAVIKVPVTYPTEEVDGIMVSGFLTPGLVHLKTGTVWRGVLERAGAAESIPGGRRSFSPVLRTTMRIHENRASVYLLDEKDDGVDGVTTAVITIDGFEFKQPGAGGEDSIVVSVPRQTVTCPLNGYSSWVRVLASAKGELGWGWARLVPEMISGKLLQIGSTPVYNSLERSSVEFCYPDTLRSAIAERFERFIPFISYTVPTIPDMVDDDAEYLRFFLGIDDWDLFIYEFQVTDVIQHWDGAGRYTRDVYMRIDRLLGELVSQLPENTVLVLASDHGAREYRFKLNLDRWLDDLRLLAKDRRGRIDYANSIAFHFYWGIYVNERELENRWRVVPGFYPEEGKNLYDSFLDFLIEEANLLALPRSSRPIPVTLLRSPADRVEPAPDLVVQPEYKEYAVKLEEEPEIGDDIVIPPGKDKRRFAHKRKGIYLFYGPGIIRKGAAGGLRDIYDITPTLLYILGLPVAVDFDGKIMAKVFEAGFLDRNRPNTISTYRVPGKRKRHMESAEREALEEILRAIGYIQ